MVRVREGARVGACKDLRARLLLLFVLLLLVVDDVVAVAAAVDVVPDAVFIVCRSS